MTTDVIFDTNTKPSLKPRVDLPRQYHVVFLNDDFTTMEFVVRMLCEIFHKPETDAVATMLEIHHAGRAVAATYSHEIAEQKICETMEQAKQSEYPLIVTMEEAPS